MTNYSVGNFIIAVKNACLAKRREITVSQTKLVKAVALALKKMGYLDEVTAKEGILSARIVYRRKEPVLMGAKLVSKPGLRIYMGANELEKIKRPSKFIVSTSKGILTSSEAKKARLGGEIIAEVW